MKTKLYYANLLLLVFSFCIIFSCQDVEVDKKFENTPTERVEQQNNELQNALLSSPAFRAVYFPNDREYGGFTFYMKFFENGEVTMSSDYDSTTFAKKTTIYSIKQIATTTLIFDTRNHIHKLSDNFFPPNLFGTGFEGHSQFSFIEYDESSGTVYLGDPRSESSLTLEPISEDTWNNAENLVELSNAQRLNLLPTLTRPVFSILSYSNGSETFNYDLEYDQLRRSFDATFIDENRPGPERFEFGIAGTIDGLKVSPRIQFEDNIFEFFDYDENLDHFISTNGDATLIISPSFKPAIVSNYHEQFRQINSGVVQFVYAPDVPEIGDGSLTSPAFKQLYDDMGLQTFLGQPPLVLFEFDFTGSPSDCPCTLLINGGPFNQGSYCFEAPIIRDNIIYLDYLSPANPKPEHVELLEFFGRGHNEGIIIEGRGDFASEDGDNRFANPSVTIVSLNDPTLRVYGIAAFITPIP